MDINGIKSEILNWNIDFPIDRWWREKHKIPFMSSAHREISFLDQYFEYQEDLFFNQSIPEKGYEPNIGEWLSEPEVNELNKESFINMMRKEMIQKLEKENG